MLTAVDNIVTVTPFGIRFWDPVMDNQIRDGLKVTVRREITKRPIVTAYRTRSDVYTFHHIPGMRDIESGTAPIDIASPPNQRNYIVEIRDPLFRYVDVGLVVKLPLLYKGVYLANNGTSPPHSSPKGILLYSAPTRQTANLTTAVRGELKCTVTDGPAAYAVIKVTTHEGKHWYGIANEEGMFIVLMPYPVLVESITGSPPPTSHKQMYEQLWDLQIEVFYQPEAQVDLPESDLKDYRSILNQAQALIWRVSIEDGGTPTTSINVEHSFGKDSVLKTRDNTKLFVTPVASIP